MRRMRVYLAGPISGTSYDECTGWRERVASELGPIADCVSPMRGKHYLRNERILDGVTFYPERVLSTVQAVTYRDRWDLSCCDIMLANFTDASHVSIGTCIEFGWADAARKPIIVVLPDGNPHDHGMLRFMATAVVKSLDEAIEVIKILVSTGLEDQCQR